jgi:hypothetical protein
MQRRVTNVAASVRQRLLNRARAEGRAFQELGQSRCAAAGGEGDVGAVIGA